MLLEILSEDANVSHSRSIAVQVIKIAVQRVTVKLDGDYLLRGGIGDPERFLQTFEHPLAVLVWKLTMPSVRINRYKSYLLTALTLSEPASSSFSLVPSGGVGFSASTSAADVSCHHM